jgi:hypothetical protein
LSVANSRYGQLVNNLGRKGVLRIDCITAQSTMKEDGPLSPLSVFSREALPSLG